MAATYSTTFEVEGRGEFPFDMLRYDCAYPADGDAVFFFHNAPTEFIKMRLRTWHEGRTPRITNDRWASFGWSVDPATVDTRKVS